MRTEKELYYLSELSDYKIDDGYPDVLGWEVKDSALRRIGSVNNLLVNTKAERVVYLDVEVDASIIDAKHDPYSKPINSELREFVNENGENHIIIPIGLVDINMSDEYVFTESIDHSTFAGTKRILKNAAIDRDYEHAVLTSFSKHYPADSHFADGPKNNTNMRRETEKENIDKRQDFGEYHESEPIETQGKVDWYVAKNKSAQTWEELHEDDFYSGKEFDDSRFRNS